MDNETLEITLKPIFKGVVFDNELECRWAVFFNELGFRWQYKPDWEVKTEGASQDAEHLTFKVGHSNWGQNIGWFYVIESVENFQTYHYNNLLDQIESSNTPVILLDGPPRPGAFVKLSFDFSAQRGRSDGFLDGLDLAAKAWERSGSVVHPCQVNMPYTEGYFFEDPDNKRIVREIKKAVKAADKLFLNAAAKLGGAS